MGWGAMGGLGQALTNVGQQWDEKNKMELRNKLEADREMARESRAEARTKRTVADRRLENVGGKYMWREVNSYGEPIREVEASPEEVKQIQNEAKLSDLSVRKGSAEATVAEVTAADAPASVERKIAEHKSGLAKDAESIRASRDASARGWKSLELEGQRNAISEKGLAAKLSGADDEASVDVVQDLRKQLGTQIGQLQQEYGLSVSDMNNAIMGAYQEALATSKRTGKKPSEWLNGTVFVDNLNRYLKRRAQ